MPTWDPKAVFPQAGLEEIGKLETTGRAGVVYSIIKAVTPN
jgi:hypothetical protein